MSVMNVKRTTQVAPKGAQANPKGAEVGSSIGADDFKAAFGDQAVGDVLNKVANPNWVDPSKQMRATGNNQMDKDAFFKLMLAQMKNQDPTKPMESHEMAAQLAQFTSLEQLTNINSTLETMSKTNSPNSNFQALAFIGKKVSGDSSKITRVPGDTRHSFGFDLLGDAQKVTVEIKDGGGNTIRKMESGAFKKGRNTLEWNGLTDQGTPARPGEYKFVLEAKNTAGSKVWAKTAFEGRITGLNYGSDGPVLLVGNQSIKLSDVRKIEDPGPEDMIPSQKPGAVTPLKAESKEEISAAEEEPMQAGNIDAVPMSRELLNQVAKMTK